MFCPPRRLLLAGALSLAAVSVVTACSSGQVTQTSTQVATVNGSSANVGDLALRNIRILYPEGGNYAEGETARLVLVVTNQGLAEDTLIEVTGEFFDSAAIEDSEDSEDSEAAEDAGASTSPTARPEPSTAPGDGESAAGVEVVVPAQGILVFDTSELGPIELSDLTQELMAAQIVSLTFTFENAGEVTVEVPVANPTEEIDRGEGFDYHGEEGE